MTPGNEPYGNAMDYLRAEHVEHVHVHYRLRVPGALIAEMVPDYLPPIDAEDDRWLIALEERIKDRLPDLLCLAVDDPDVEVS